MLGAAVKFFSSSHKYLQNLQTGLWYGCAILSSCLEWNTKKLLLTHPSHDFSLDGYSRCASWCTKVIKWFVLECRYVWGMVVFSWMHLLKHCDVCAGLMVLACVFSRSLHLMWISLRLTQTPRRCWSHWWVLLYSVSLCWLGQVHGAQAQSPGISSPSSHPLPPVSVHPDFDRDLRLRDLTTWQIFFKKRGGWHRVFQATLVFFCLS